MVIHVQQTCLTLLAVVDPAVSRSLAVFAALMGGCLPLRYGAQAQILHASGISERCAAVVIEHVDPEEVGDDNVKSARPREARLGVLLQKILNKETQK
jgi:hypothetical protein